MFRRIGCPRWQHCAIAIAGVCLLTLLSLISPALAHEGHDHGDDDRANAATLSFPRVAVRSAAYEIVGMLKDGRWSITLDDARTNAPVTDAKVRVFLGEATPADAEPKGPGLFSIAHDDSLTGTIAVTFAVSGRAGDEVLAGTLDLPAPSRDAHAEAAVPPHGAVGFLVVLALGCAVTAMMLRTRQRAAARVAALASAMCVAFAIGAFAWKAKPHADTPLAQMRSDAPRRNADGSAYAAKPTQRLLDVRTQPAEIASARPASHLIGRVIANPNRSSIAQSLYGGRVMASDNALPRIGQSVAKGDVLVQIDPYLPIADRTTISEKVGEIEQLMAVAETRLRRLRPLASGGAVPTSQISDLEIELEGLKARRETVLTLRANREVVRAPTDGIITSANAVPGQVIQPQDILFQIADPQSLWIEASAYGDSIKVAAQATATGVNGEPFALEYLGASRALRQHATIMHFAIPAPPNGLNIGQPVTVLVQSGAPTEGFIVPRNAIVTSGSGESIVWLHEAPERFEPRSVRTAPVDAARVLVQSGLGGGERVVVRGADLVNQIR